MQQKTKLLATACAVAFGLLAGCSHHTPGTLSNQAAAQDALHQALSPSGIAQTAKAVRQSQLPQPVATTPQTAYATLNSGNQLMFLYYALSGLPPDYDSIAQKYSVDYRNTSDEFRKHDLMAALKPQIDASIKAAANQRYVIWTVGNTRIGHYDFNKKAFPLDDGILQQGGSGYFFDNSSYQIEFVNGAAFASMPVADENVAKDIEARVSRYQGFNIQIDAFAQSADPSDHHVKCVITRVSLLAPDGTTLATTTTGAPA